MMKPTINGKRTLYRTNQTADTHKESSDGTYHDLALHKLSEYASGSSDS